MVALDQYQGNNQVVNWCYKEYFYMTTLLVIMNSVCYREMQIVSNYMLFVEYKSQRPFKTFQFKNAGKGGVS